MMGDITLYIGWFGGVLLALCGLPEVIRTVKYKHCYVGWGMLISWLLGELCLLIYEMSGIISNARMFNYTVNIIFISIMIYYKRRTNVL